MKMLHQQFAVFLGLTIVSASCRESFFRRDYTFFEEFNAFYKLHWADSASTWDGAYLTCDDEGSQMFYPAGADEWQIAANLSESLTDVEGIFVGVRDEFGRGNFLSIDGRFIPEFSKKHVKDEDASESKCVVMSVRTGANSIGSCKHRQAFICKKVNDEICPTADSSYIYSKTTKKCYKVNERRKTWEDALHTCFMEGGILTTTLQKSEEKIISALLTPNKYYFIGFRRIMPLGDFYSLQGLKIEISGNPENDCGSFVIESRNGNSSEIPYPQKLRATTMDCNISLPFICEIWTST